MKQRFQNLLKSISTGVFEKETELGMSLLAAVAGQSILLLGPPGVAKSMIARRLKLAFAHARTFEYLMSRFSTPDEIFGPVSIKQLKDHDIYARRTVGYLPEADVVFLDEIWKAGPAIQNSLLQVINEKTFLNGDKLSPVPLKLLLAASNELPTQGEGLEALWDRFIIRLICQPIQSEQAFYNMLCHPATSQEEEIEVTDPIRPEEYQQWQEQIDQIALPEEVLKAITSIRKQLKDVKIDGQDVRRDLYVSDRRWQRIARLLRTSAFMHDRETVALSDLQLIVHTLWNEPDEISAVGRIVANALFDNFQDRLAPMQAHVAKAMRQRQCKDAIERAHLRGDHRDDDLIIYDWSNYGIADNPSQTQPTLFIPVTEFKMLPTHTSDEPALRGVMYQDPDNQKRRLIRAYNNPDNLGIGDTELTRVNLYRDSSNIYVNGVRYALRRASRTGDLHQLSGFEPVLPNEGTPIDAYEQLVDELYQESVMFAAQLKNHLFRSNDIALMVNSRMEGFKRQVALLRASLRKLIYDE